MEFLEDGSVRIPKEPDWYLTSKVCDHFHVPYDKSEEIPDYYYDVFEQKEILDKMSNSGCRCPFM